VTADGAPQPDQSEDRGAAIGFGGGKIRATALPRLLHLRGDHLGARRLPDLSRTALSADVRAPQRVFLRQAISVELG
jgi:hypothetical protein